MRGSQNTQVSWLYYQNAPYIAFQSVEEAPAEFRPKLHAYTYGDKAGDKKGTVEYRFYVDFDATFLGCVWDKGKFGDGITYTFKDMDDGRIYKLTVPFDNKGKQLFFRLCSIAKKTKVFSCEFNASVSNGIATFGKFINVTGENGMPTNPLHQGTYYNGIEFIENPHVIKPIEIAWNETCEFFFKAEGAEEVQKAKSEFYAVGARVKTPFPTKNQQSKFWDAYEAMLAQYTETKLVSMLNDVFQLNIEQAPQLAAPVVSAALPETDHEAHVVDAEQEKKIAANKVAQNAQAPLVIEATEMVVPDIIKLDDSEDMPF